MITLLCFLNFLLLLVFLPLADCTSADLLVTVWLSLKFGETETKMTFHSGSIANALQRK